MELDTLRKTYKVLDDNRKVFAADDEKITGISGAISAVSQKLNDIDKKQNDLIFGVPDENTTLMEFDVLVADFYEMVNKIYLEIWPVLKKKSKAVPNAENMEKIRYAVFAECDKRDKVKQKARKKRAAAICAVLAVVVFGASMLYCAEKYNWYNPELNSAIYKEFESEEFATALKSLKHNKIDPDDTYEVAEYIEDISNDIGTSIISDYSFGFSGTLKYKSAILTGNFLDISYIYDGTEHINTSYELNDQQLSDLLKLLESDDANVRLKLPAFINTLVDSNNIINKTSQNLSYTNPDIGSLSLVLTEILNSQGYDLIHGFYIKSANQETGVVTIGYIDDNLTSEFTIKCEGIMFRSDGTLCPAVISEEIYANHVESVIEQFKANENQGLNLSGYFTDPEVYSSDDNNSN